MTDFASLRKAQRRPQQSVALCLRGDLFGELERVNEQLRQAVTFDGAGDSLAGAGLQVSALRDRAGALREQMAESTFTFVFEALPRAEFVALEDGFDLAPGEDFPPAYLQAVVAASMVEPKLTGTELAEFYSDLSSGQCALLENAALGVNRETGANPFLSSACAPTPVTAPS